MKILRIIIALLLVAICILSCVACEKDSDTSADSGSPSSTKKDNEDKDSDGTVKMYVKYNDVKIAIGAKADSIIEALGEPQSKTEIGDCGGLGAQVKYVYPSIEVYVLESKTEGNIIDQITFRDDIVSTPEGVCIGATVSEAKEALGKPTSETEKALLYTSGKYTLKLSISDGAVSEINYITQTN
ncbi:MAG: hypothetical protein E7653_03155 [Ruminococcaceae bacterium]|nr:hypothetical protein [Oscillospiraceae bacterium]